MNTLTEAEVAEMLGENGWKEIQILRERLRLPQRGYWRARFAPSIIARSELELFGLSTPRFAVRIYVDNSGKSFINARRIETFRQQFAEWGKRNNISPDRQLNFLQPFPPTQSPAEMLKSKPCVADCLLAPPADVQNYKILKAKLGVAYGEEHDPGKDFEGTSYVRHIPVTGGGLCAQAVCFMATALSYNLTKGVYGLAEVTKLATRQECEELCVAGLNVVEMVQYFDSVGLGAISQKSVGNPSTFSPTYFFAAALRAYLHSNIPVVLLVDMGRMAGNFNGVYPPHFMPRTRSSSIYSANEFEVALDAQYQYRHAILLVGVAGNTENFLFNDPSAHPFMKATTEDLTVAAAYNGPAMVALETQVCLPITPREVRLPLLNWRGEDELNASVGDWHAGLLNKAYRLQNGLYPSGFPTVWTSQQFDRMRLTTIGEMSSLNIFEFSNNPSIDEALKGKVLQLSNELEQRLLREKDHWVWIQSTASSVWIWDAEKDLPSQSNGGDFDQRTGNLRAIINYQNMAWEITHYPSNTAVTIGTRNNAGETSEANENLRDDGASVVRKPLLPSLITSYTIRGVQNKGRSFHWPKDLRFAELYAFMQSDADALPLPNLTGRDEKLVTAIDRMAALVNADEATIRQIAEDFADPFKAHNAQIVSMATFVPEITSSNESKAKKAKDALLFLVKLAKQFQNIGHPVATIEMVAGSLIDGMWPASDSREPDPVYGANLLTVDLALERLLRQLLPVAQEAVRDPMKRVQFAFELEPGPLHALGDFSRVKKFCDKLAETSLPCELYKTVGLNLDIPHWAFLAKVSLAEARQVFSRIIHAHISDHGKGHFCDDAIYAVHDANDYQPWIDLLTERNASCDGPVRFSGFISNELEACKDFETVQFSVKNSLSLVGAPGT